MYDKYLNNLLDKEKSIINTKSDREESYTKIPIVHHSVNSIPTSQTETQSLSSFNLLENHFKSTSSLLYQLEEKEYLDQVITTTTTVTTMTSDSLMMLFENNNNDFYNHSTMTDFTAPVSVSTPPHATP